MTLKPIEFDPFNPVDRELLKKRERISGSDILLRMLLLEGVDCVFGYPGGAVLFIYDAMYGNESFRHLLTRHEQGAIHAADGYARATGKTGVCLATSGPGATNLVTGIATAYMDSIPLVIVTGNVATSLIGTDAFQEADIVGITQPITKHSFFVQRVEDLAVTIRKAFFIAGTGRKGPVLIDIPKDVSAAVTEFIYPEMFEIKGYRPNEALDMKAIDLLVEEVLAASKPLILAGGGLIQADASPALTEFAQRNRIPVTTTLMGLGVFPSSDELWLGMPGMHGTYAANQALLQCDLLIAVGARFDDRVTMRLDGFAPQSKIVHIDIDAAEIAKLVPTALGITGDAKVILEELNRRLCTPLLERPWNEQVRGWKREKPLRYTDNGSELKPQFVMELLSRTTNGKAIITTDVGQHQMWAAQFYKYNHPRSFITSGGLGTMGFGLPSAIGAQIGRPDQLVISINGDGGVQMCIQELAICAINQIPVKIVVINNQTLGMIRQWQEVIYSGRFTHIDLSGSPDFVKLAEAYGVKGLRAASKVEAEQVWEAALNTPGPVLIDFIVPKDELVLPMIPHGKTLHDMILEVE
ncbi:biosynthetic-type acetolactate synthase large subunit [Paenibacillus turpanensis]|uniref:biosynthetic-type acetolactate synthase large subunit n=1 Tax=Paenibacillus turpanensis TaxID=2689078 RepID=UPI0014074F5F|nr:biosynthetic-type acetolactate synthase large subunit [Paenibacillus turpanensis]